MCNSNSVRKPQKSRSKEYIGGKSRQVTARQVALVYASCPFGVLNIVNLIIQKLKTV